MIPVVSNKYRYVFFYNPKSACSVARKLFLDLHRDELNEEQTEHLASLKAANQDEWHNINTLFPYDENADYSDYFKFTLVRHPSTRIISAYLNRIVLLQSDKEVIKASLKALYGIDVDECSFAQFLDYLNNNTASDINNQHFLPQTYLQAPLDKHFVGSKHHRRFYQEIAAVKNLFSSESSPLLKLDAVCKMENLSADLLNVYKTIFKNEPNKVKQVEKMLSALPIHNATFVSDKIERGAENLTADVLRNRGQMPSYDSFLTTQTLEKISSLFSDDFAVFNYKVKPDERSRLSEKNKNLRINEVVPNDFDWQHYINANSDLKAAGIDNKARALNHWIHHGHLEDREYKK